MWAKVFLVSALFAKALAYPTAEIVELEERYDGFPKNLNERLGFYIPPGPNDSRGPCPALNTLANHGLINRDGKNLLSSDLKHAFMRGFGINPDAITVARKNFEIICGYIKGSTCAVNPGEPHTDYLLTNLTILSEPHAFEHDHSFSRQDYKEGYGKGNATNNISFNSTIFQGSLDVINYKPSNPPKIQLADYKDFSVIHLQRISIQNTNDMPGWFIDAQGTTLFETGFIFGVTCHRFPNGSFKNPEHPKVRVDWWNYWFSEESFPTQLGWVPAHTSQFEVNFVLSVSSKVLHVPITSTPSNLPPHATIKNPPVPSPLPHQDPSPTFELYKIRPYVAPTAPYLIHGKHPLQTGGPHKANPNSNPVSSSTADALKERAPEPTQGPKRPRVYNWYRDTMDLKKMQAQMAEAQSYESAYGASMTQ